MPFKALEKVGERQKYMPSILVSLLAMHALDYCKFDVVEAHCYIVDIGQTDSEQICS